MKILLPIFYLPPISWFSEFLKEENEVVLEQFENFPKQTYRNRTNVYGANGKLSLIIPIHHTGEANKTSYWWLAVAILVLFFGWEYFVKLFKGKEKEYNFMKI